MSIETTYIVVGCVGGVYDFLFIAFFIGGTWRSTSGFGTPVVVKLTMVSFQDLPFWWDPSTCCCPNPHFYYFLLYIMVSPHVFSEVPYSYNTLTCLLLISACFCSSILSSCHPMDLMVDHHVSTNWYFGLFPILKKLYTFSGEILIFFQGAFSLDSRLFMTPNRVGAKKDRLPYLILWEFVSNPHFCWLNGVKSVEILKCGETCYIYLF